MIICGGFPVDQHFPALVAYLQTKHGEMYMYQICTAYVFFFCPDIQIMCIFNRSSGETSRKGSTRGAFTL